jgi:hypothetical protein
VAILICLLFLLLVRILLIYYGEKALRDLSWAEGQRALRAPRLGEYCAAGRRRLEQIGAVRQSAGDSVEPLEASPFLESCKQHVAPP